MNFVSSVRWVKRGVGKRKPLEVHLSPQELAAILRQNQPQTQGNLDESNEITNGEDEVYVNDAYAFKYYDNEPGQSLGIENIVEFGSEADNNSDNTAEAGPEDDDYDDSSDAEDDLIHPDDNLILVGHVEEDASVLEVYVYNKEKGYMYVHHDILLPTLPLCLEWLNLDPNNPRQPGNLVAIGGMNPEIDVWDLDIVNCTEPAFKLGRYTRNHVLRSQNHGHTDAVLDMSWNKHLEHILASGSVDMSVLLWDIEAKKAVTRFSGFTDKVQSLEWHPTEVETLLTGSADSTVRFYDCRLENTLWNLNVNGEVEKVIWDPYLQCQAFVGTSAGLIYSLDCRNKNISWLLAAHNMEITDIGMSANEPGFMITCSMDGWLKKWDLGEGRPINVWSKALSIGELYGLDINPENPNIVAIAGARKSNNFIVVDSSHNMMSGI